MATARRRTSEAALGMCIGRRFPSSPRRNGDGPAGAAHTVVTGRSGGADETSSSSEAISGAAET
jgi:hypothetical protein